MHRSRKLAVVVAVSLATIGGAMSFGGVTPAWGDGGEMQRLSDAEVITAVDRAAAARDERRAGEAVNELRRRWNTADRAVLAKAAATYGVDAAEMGRAALIGQGAHLLSPLVPSTYLLVGLNKVEFGDLQKFALLPAIGVSMIWLATAILLGHIHL